MNTEKKTTTKKKKVDKAAAAADEYVADLEDRIVGMRETIEDRQKDAEEDYATIAAQAEEIEALKEMVEGLRELNIDYAPPEGHTKLRK